MVREDFSEVWTRRIIQVAQQSGIDPSGLTPLNVLDEMGRKLRHQAIELIQGKRRGEELEAENRELKKRIQELGG